MFTHGIVTIYVSDFDRTIEFYSKTLGLKLDCRYGNDWAEVSGGGLTIWIHGPAEHVKPGIKGSMSIGFGVAKIEAAVAQLRERGVSFHGDIVDSDAVKLATFGDPDGTPIYLCEVKHGASDETCAGAKPAAKKKARPARAKAKSRK